MKALVCREFGPPESLVLADVPSPTLGATGVRIGVCAVGLNFPDTLMIAGKYQVKPQLPFSPGMECAGTVLEVGAEITSFKVGDRVMSVPGYGSMAEEVVAPAPMVYPIPDDVPFVEAAGIPTTYGTALYALAHRGRLQPGEVLLVHGAAGGVGLSAVELGKLLGATVIACASTDEKLAVAKRYGADHLINSLQGNLRDQVKLLMDGKGADVIFDPVGGDTFDQSLRCIAWDGRILVIGFASGRIPQIPASLVLVKSCDIVGVFWGAYSVKEPEKTRDGFRQIFEWRAAGKLRPHISQTFPLAAAPEAMNVQLGRKAIGKVVITVP
jgi:NADPH2:quinone reductase